jgi:hypothetical protein
MIKFIKKTIICDNFLCQILTVACILTAVRIKLLSPGKGNGITFLANVPVNIGRITSSPNEEVKLFWFTFVGTFH